MLIQIHDKKMLIHTLDKTVHLLDLGKCFYVFTCTFEPECCESVDTYTKQKKRFLSSLSTWLFKWEICKNDPYTWQENGFTYFLKVHRENIDLHKKQSFILLCLLSSVLVLFENIDLSTSQE